MKTKLVLFGVHIDMAPCMRRRRLVVAFYALFGSLLLASWAKGSQTGGGFLTIEFTLLVGPLLGGYFAGINALTGKTGLVEPFEPRKTLKYPESASIFRPSSLLHPVEDNDPELRSDERATRRRDHAHYISHGFLGSVIAAGFLLEFDSNSGISWSHMSPVTVNKIVYFLLQILYISSMTLPQAILLWTEPDMEEQS